MVRINSLSDALGIEILGKAEASYPTLCLQHVNLPYSFQFLNPGGSVKDRVALRSEFRSEKLTSDALTILSV